MSTTQRLETQYTRHPMGRATMRGREARSTETAREAAIEHALPRAKALGWLSLGLGLWQATSPRGAARAIGIDGDDTNAALLTAIGVREIVLGAGILAQAKPTSWLWTRFAGDLMDLALLGAAFAAPSSNKSRVALAATTVAGVTLADFFTARELSGKAVPGGPRYITKVITVNRPADELYRFWRVFPNLPRFMANVEGVQMLDERRSRWVARGPMGASISWEAEITADRPNELIAWRTISGSDVKHAGTVAFLPAPGDRGTEVRVEMRFDPPGGLFGATLVKVFGKDPAAQLDVDLRRFKQVMEVGEVVYSDASIYRRPHPARPPESVGYDGSAQ